MPDCEHCPDHSGMEATFKAIGRELGEIKSAIEKLRDASFLKALGLGFGIGTPIAAAVTTLLYLLLKGGKS